MDLNKGFYTIQLIFILKAYDTIPVLVLRYYYGTIAGPGGYKTFSELNSAGHEILNAHKYKNKYQEIQLFYRLRYFFFFCS